MESYYNVKEYGAVGDGVCDDTISIQKCMDYAQEKKGVAFFPSGTYLISSTIYFGRKDSDSANEFTIQGTGTANTQSMIKMVNDGNMAETGSEAKVCIKGLAFLHEGKSGNILRLEKGFGHGVYDCMLIRNGGNLDDMLYFTGSYVEIVNTGFGNAEPNCYAIRCTTEHGKININSNIFDCRIWGIGKGLLIDSVPGNRPEGLKVSRNMFLNTGEEQITIETVLHVDISNNMLDQCCKTSVLIRPVGHSVCGAFLLGNYISPAKDQVEGICVLIEQDEKSLMVLSLHMANNMLAYAGYGIVGGSNLVNANICNNTINDITHCGIELDGSKDSIIENNSFWNCGVSKKIG